MILFENADNPLFSLYLYTLIKEDQTLFLDIFVCLRLILLKQPNQQCDFCIWKLVLPKNIKEEKEKMKACVPLSITAKKVLAFNLVRSNQNVMNLLLLIVTSLILFTCRKCMIQERLHSSLFVHIFYSMWIVQIKSSQDRTLHLKYHTLFDLKGKENS